MIGVLGGDGALRDTLQAAGASAEARSPADVTDCDLVLAVGPAALGELVTAGVDVPVLPVECGIGPHGTTTDRAVEAADRLADGDVTVRTHPRIRATVAGDTRAHGVLDVVLRTDAPARISEYAVAAGDRVDRFRADGVAVATPLGSTGYARAAGGPVLDHGSECLAVVPIAAFALGTDTAVVSRDHAPTLTVERDETAVVLDVDGRDVGRVPAGAPVRLAIDGRLGIARLRGAGTETL